MLMEHQKFKIQQLYGCYKCPQSNKIYQTQEFGFQSKLATTLEQEKFSSMESSAFDVTNVNLLLKRLRIIGLPSWTHRNLAEKIHFLLLYMEKLLYQDIRGWHNPRIYSRSISLCCVCESPIWHDWFYRICRQQPGNRLRYWPCLTHTKNGAKNKNHNQDWKWMNQKLRYVWSTKMTIQKLNLW